jgi:WD40 repeat protein/serine/threonine protein kinase
MLRRAVSDEFDGEEFAGSSAAPDSSKDRFEHYELAKDEDGMPIELGRGAMGVTYKALDVDLHCPVTLKVISELYLGDESARLRFLREARAAARVRHTNVASVFHLGRTGSSYFYAMEFVEGETLEKIIKRSGQLEVKLALEIATQVAAGLAAVHKQKLVHRDIKPSNIMVSFDDGGVVTAKIIDLGLAKAVNEAGSQTAISIPGGFAGTPEFASPEQFAGVGADIRSDLYSLGVTLWEMLVGRAPFRGSPAEVMHQHLHAPLPLATLRYAPKPVVTLLKSLLAKNPTSRPQNPSNLLALLGKVRAESDTKRPAGPRRIRRASKHGTAEGPDPNRLHHIRTTAQNMRGDTRGSAGLLSDAWDFGPFLGAKLKNFTGRRWLFQEIDDWRVTGSEPALLIIGEAGIGKSAIVAALVDKNAGGQVLAYHCFRADTPATLEPAVFVRSLIAMLSARLSDYAAMLKQSNIVNTFQSADTDPASAFEGAIVSPLHKLRQPQGGRRYLLFDALDEALLRAQGPTVIEMLSTRLSLLPPWVCIVGTTRSEPDVLSRLGGLCARTLTAQDPRNQDDVRHFVHERLAEPALRDKVEAGAKTLSALEEDLLKSSAGNFLFVTTALDSVQSGQLSFDQIEKLPPGLSSLYKVFFDRLFRDTGVDYGSSRGVLEVVATAREPLTREQIAAVTGLDASEELPRILSRLASFVPASEGRYSFFHKSLFDWLTGWDIRQDQPFAGAYHVNLQKGWIRLADWCLAEYHRGLPNLSSYCLRHLPTHLHQVGRDHTLGTVLSDFNFLQGKLEATDAQALIADYEYLPEGADLRLVQSAVRLSAHVLARDHRQLAGQLTGRLLGNPAPIIQVLLKGAAESRSWPRLQPLTSSLAPPGGPMIRTFEGHTDWVRAVVLTRDGRGAISGSWDGTLRVWDLESGQLVRTLEAHTDRVNAKAHIGNAQTGAVAITPDGDRAISASADRTLRLWDLESGQLLRALEGHTDRVNAVAVTPDCDRAISASGDRTLRVWDLKSGQSVRTLEGHLDVVNAVAVTPDSHGAVSASSDHTLRVWDLESGQSVRTLEGHLDGVNAVAITPDGRRAISGSADHTLRVWDLESGQSVRTLEGHTNSVTAVFVMPDGRGAISGSADHTVRMWDLESSQLVRTLEGHTDWVTAVVVTPDGRRAISASADHTLRMWDLERGRSVHALAGHTDSVTAVALMPDGRGAALVSDYHVLRAWDLESGQLLRALKGHTDWVTAVAATPDGRRAVSASADHTLRAWDLGSGHSVRTLEGHTDLVSAVAVTPDGRRAISASADRTLRIWDLESGRSVHTLEGIVNLVSAVTVTPNGRCALWGSDVGALLVWDLEIGETVRALEGHSDWVTAVAITPDKRRAMSASAGGTLRLWDLERAQLVRTLEDHADPVNAVAVTPDGHRAISASSEHTLRVWDVESGIFITAFTGESPMLRCAISPDGRTIIAREKSGRGHFLRLEGLELTKV